MGDQRRFACQASDPPQTAGYRGRKGNGSTPSPFPPTWAGAKFTPHLSRPLVLTSTLLDAPSRSCHFHTETPVPDNTPAIHGCVCPVVPALDRGGGSRVRYSRGRVRQDNPLSVTILEQNRIAGPHTAPPASARAACHVSGSPPARGKRRAGKASGRSSFSVCISSATCMRTRGQITPVTYSPTVHTEEEGTNVAQRTGQWRPVQQRTVCQREVECLAGSVLADSVYHHSRALSYSICPGKRPGDWGCALGEQSARNSCTYVGPPD